MTAVIRAALIAASLALSLPGCATTQQAVPHDPWEHFNRGTQRFNDAIDRAVLKPVATALSQVRATGDPHRGQQSSR